MPSTEGSLSPPLPLLFFLFLFLRTNCSEPSISIWKTWTERSRRRQRTLSGREGEGGGIFTVALSLSFSLRSQSLNNFCCLSECMAIAVRTDQTDFYLMARGVSSLSSPLFLLSSLSPPLSCGISYTLILGV